MSSISTIPASRGRRFPVYSTAGHAGASFKPQHFAAIEAEPFHGFLEIHAENYMGDGGVPHAMLGRIRERHPLSVHGVGMSIGGPNPIDRDHLMRFASLVERYEPALVSEHLAWSTHDDLFYNDLLPLPYTDATLAAVCDHVDEVQEAIGQPILMENPSTYLLFSESSIPETEFIAEMARRTGCGLLLDVNNVFVSATNHGLDPLDYLDAFPLDQVGEIHLGGHDRQSDDHGRPLLIDSHDRPVADPVWDLYEWVLERCGPLPSLVEWDGDVPEWPVLRAESDRAAALLCRTMDRHRGSVHAHAR